MAPPLCVLGGGRRGQGVQSQRGVDLERLRSYHCRKHSPKQGETRKKHSNFSPIPSSTSAPHWPTHLEGAGKGTRLMQVKRMGLSAYWAGQKTDLRTGGSTKMDQHIHTH